MIDEKARQDIMLFRYGVIAPLLNVDLKPGEQFALIQELSKKSYHIPNTDRTMLSSRSIERYLETFRKEGLDGLKPKNREDLGTVRVIPEEILSIAKQLRIELPSRSVEQVINIIEMSGKAPKGMLRPRTLSQYFKNQGITRHDLGEKENGIYHRYQKPHRNSVWQGDTQTTLYLPDPKNPSRKRAAYLMTFMDDFSRLCCHGEFAFADNRFHLESTLRKAILKYGKPNRIYVDNGPVYSSKYLEWICARLKIELMHSKVFRPVGRGKIERFFRHVDSSFKDEAYLLINQGEIHTLEELNRFFSVWIDAYYQQRVHSAIKKTPSNAFNRDTYPISMPDAEELHQAFLWKEERKVDKAGCISMFGNLYEVEPSLAKQKVYVLYNPFDLKDIEVFKDEKSFGMAKPLTIVRDVHKELKQAEEKTAPSTGLNYLLLLKAAHDQMKKEELKLSFRSIVDVQKSKEVKKS